MRSGCSYKTKCSRRGGERDSEKVPKPGRTGFEKPNPFSREAIETERFDARPERRWMRSGDSYKTKCAHRIPAVEGRLSRATVARLTSARIACLRGLTPVALVSGVMIRACIPLANRMTIQGMDEIHGPVGGVDSQPEIPDKLFFRIGEVSHLVGVEPYVLRYWESEFKGLSPKKSSSGQRMFRRKDVELLLEIKRLLYERKFTIEGARKALAAQKDQERVLKITPTAQAELFPGANPLVGIRRELADILKLLAAH